MLKNYVQLLSCLLLPGFVLAQSAGKQQEDREAIKNMCGCMEVSFEYAETFPSDTNYSPKGYHKIDGAIEYVALVKDETDHIILQHLLIAGGGVIKHWTEDWIYQGRQLLQYDKDQQWVPVQLPVSSVSGQWTQKVYGVDDEPRYEGTATWVHTDGRHYWEATSDAPLPRREYTTRNDYNVMRRTNHHEITGSGSVHEQDNLKIVRAAGKDSVIVKEKGLNTYKRVDDARCEKAIAWWKQHQEFWAKVREAWQGIYAQNKPLQLQRQYKGQSLYKTMLDLERQAFENIIRGKVLDEAIQTTLQHFTSLKNDLSIKR